MIAELVATVLPVGGVGKVARALETKLLRVSAHSRVERLVESSRGRVGVLDSDSGFIQGLSKRLAATGLGHHLISAQSRTRR